MPHFSKSETKGRCALWSAQIKKKKDMLKLLAKVLSHKKANWVDRKWRLITVSPITTSKRLDLLFFLCWVFCLRKYFWAWLATCVGVLVGTKFLEMPLQSPLPSLCNPAKKVLCSSSVHGTHNNQTNQKLLTPFFVPNKQPSFFLFKHTMVAKWRQQVQSRQKLLALNIVFHAIPR